MEKNIYAYCRVSTENQRLERQEKNIKIYWGELADQVFFFEEKFTGTTQKRNEWKKVSRLARKGDIITFDSISRMSRNAEEGYKDYMQLWEKGVSLIFLNEPHLNTEVFTSQIENIKQIENVEVKSTFQPLMDGIVETLKNIIREQIKIGFEQAEKERDDLVKRITEGQKVSVKKPGRPKKVIPETLKKDIIDGYINSRQHDVKYYLETYKISKATFYVYLNRIENIIYKNI